mgnify:CR=1 FL=1
MTHAHRTRRLVPALVAGLLIAMIGGTAHAATLAHWTFDNGTVPNAIASDTDTEASIEVTPFSTGSVTYDAGPTAFDTAANFAPDVGLRSAPRSGTLTGLSALTVEAFVKVDTAENSGSMNIFRKTALWVGSGNDGDAEDGFSFILSDGKPILRLGRDSEGNAADRDMAAVEATDAIATGQWVHLAGTWDGSAGDLKLFVDGVEVTTTAVEQGTTGNFFPTTLTNPLNDASNDGPAAIGAIDRGGDSFGQFFDGSIDEVRISDEALSPSAFIPEPATVGLLAVGGVVMLARRRRG